MTTRILVAGLFAFACVVPTFAGETVTEHETYEKRSMKVETIPPPQRTERTVEETTETSRTDRPRKPVVEEHKTIIEQPGGVVTEKRTETETRHDDD